MQSRIKHQQGKIALLGAGYVARALIPTLGKMGWEIIATTRGGQNFSGCETYAYDAEDGISGTLKTALRGCTAIISSIPPKRDRDPVVKDLSRLDLQSVEWAAYLSATSVYGDRAGQWAFEDELLFPTLKRGRRRVLAELDWLESGLPVHVFRLAGIYGPGRDPFDKILSGAAKVIEKPGHIVNRIHVEDILAALLSSMKNPNPCTVYNIADGHPAPPGDVLDYAAQLCGAPKPPRYALDKADISDMARSFYAETKRVAIDRAASELGFVPKYPTYREGLSAVWAARNIKN